MEEILNEILNLHREIEERQEEINTLASKAKTLNGNKPIERDGYLDCINSYVTY